MPSRWGWFCGLNQDPYQTGSVALYGEWAHAETELMLSFVPKGATCLDVGANVGNVSMALAHAVGDQGRVIAFEPQQFAYSCLMANIALNSLIHVVEPFMCAVGKESGTVNVPKFKLDGQVNNVGGMSLKDDREKGDDVPLITIDSLNLGRCDLIKADVEGMEAVVLEGAAYTVK